MIKPIMKDIFFLNQRSEPATEADKQVAVDLLDTLKAHEEGCVGMAANMIGVKKCIIAVNMGFMNVAMFNPKIVLGLVIIFCRNISHYLIDTTVSKAYNKTRLLIK